MESGRLHTVQTHSALILLAEPLNQPLPDAPASPILARAGRRFDFMRGGQAVGGVNAQTLEAGRGRRCAGVIDTDVSFEHGVHARGDALASVILSRSWRQKLQRFRRLLSLKRFTVSSAVN